MKSFLFFLAFFSVFPGLAKVPCKPTTLSRLAQKDRLPKVPRSFEVSSQMRKDFQEISNLLDRYNVCGGSAKCGTLLEKMEALSAKIARLKEQSENLSDPKKRALIQKQMDELSEAHLKLEEMERHTTRIYREFFSNNSGREFPYGFSLSSEFEAFKKQFVNGLRERLSQPGNEQISVYLGGSALTGLSYLPKDGGLLRKPFGEKSDFDFLVVVPEKLFSRLFSESALSDFIDVPGAASFPLDMEKLRKVISENPELSSAVRNLPYFVEQQEAQLQGRKVSIKFVTSAPESTPESPYQALTDG